MSEKELELFNVLNFLESGYRVEDILKQGEFDIFSSAEDCVNFLVENDYLLKNEGLTSPQDISKNYTVAQLKKILKENNLKVSGKKQELIERVMPILSDKSEDFVLTDKAKDFIKENQWMDLYMFALVAFKFEDYEKFYRNSSADNYYTALNFCDEVLSFSLINNQFLIFLDALSAKAHVYAYGKDYESFLNYDLQRFIIGLNPFNMDSRTYSNYEVINHANIINLKNVIEYFNFGDLKKRFNKIWKKSNISDITVPKNASYRILIKALSSDDIEELNFDLKEKYFYDKFSK